MQLHNYKNVQQGSRTSGGLNYSTWNIAANLRLFDLPEVVELDRLLNAILLWGD